MHHFRAHFARTSVASYFNIGVFMKVAIIGSRGLNLDIGKHIPKNTTLIITGGARGIDELAESYADSKCIPKLIIEPEYNKYGKAAPLIRTKTILEKADLIIIFWDGESKGTKYAIKCATSLGKKVILHRVFGI